MAANRFPDFMALCCGLLILPWILGVPGRPGKAVLYGWTAGLMAMVAYLVLYQIAKSLAARDTVKNNPSYSACINRSIRLAAIIVFALLLISFGLILAA